MRDEEYVRACWKDPWLAESQLKGYWGVVLITASLAVWGPNNLNSYATPDAAWSAARAFTVLRLEEVRQVREELDEIPIGSLIERGTLNWWALGDDDLEPIEPDIIIRHVTRQIRRLRTIARLNHELATVSAGLRPEIVADLEKWIKIGEDGRACQGAGRRGEQNNGGSKEQVNS